MSFLLTRNKSKTMIDKKALENEGLYDDLTDYHTEIFNAKIDELNNLVLASNSEAQETLLNIFVTIMVPLISLDIYFEVDSLVQIIAHNLKENPRLIQEPEKLVRHIISIMRSNPKD